MFPLVFLPDSYFRSYDSLIIDLSSTNQCISSNVVHKVITQRKDKSETFNFE